MEKIQRTLAKWRELPPVPLPLASIETDPALQPRTEDAVGPKDRAKLRRGSDEHVARLRALVEDRRSDTEPVLVAKCGERLLLVDGHHRLEAYRRAGRETIPARVHVTTRPSAVTVSKLVNCDGVKLPMHPDQHRDALWQYLAEVTRRGRLPLPSGVSLRSLAAAFGVANTTAQRMANKVPQIDARDYGPEACDPGTGWPRWRHVRGNAWRETLADVPPDKRRQAQAERLAEKVAKLWADAAPGVAELAAGLLRADGRDGAADLLDAVEDAQTGDHGDY